MYELAFTRRFKKNLDGLPHELIPLISQCLNVLERDPYESNPKAKALKGQKKTFRYKIKRIYRLQFLVNPKERCVICLAVGLRKDIYRKDVNSRSAIHGLEANEIRARVGGRAAGASAGAGLPPEVQIEEYEHWITADELWAMDVPAKYVELIEDMESPDDLETAPIPEWVRTKVAEYVTSPAPHHFGKLYSMHTTDASILQEIGLSRFLLKLTPEQKRACSVSASSGPILIKGGPGTGKTVVSLHRLREMILGENIDWVDDVESRYAFITYTNALVGAAKALFEQIVAEKGAYERCEISTLDSIALKIAKSAPETSSFKVLQAPAKILQKHVVTDMQDAEVDKLVERLGYSYLSDEIEQVIIGHGLWVDDQDEYLALNRRGRQTRLTRELRAVVWRVFIAYVEWCISNKQKSFAMIRLAALNQLEGNEGLSRYKGMCVDEAQDLSTVAKRLCVELVRETRGLVFTADTGQSIYGVPPIWSQADSRLRFSGGRTILLKVNHRTSIEISVATEPLRQELDDGELRGYASKPVFRGEKPCWYDRPNDQHATEVVAIARNLVDGHHVSDFDSIAVIVRTLNHQRLLEKMLRDADIPAYSLTKESPFQVDGGKVHIVTAHSSKGLEFPVTIVPFVVGNVYPEVTMMSQCSDDDQRAEAQAKEMRLLYVALSRGAHGLHIISDPLNPSPYSAQLDMSHFNIG